MSILVLLPCSTLSPGHPVSDHADGGQLCVQKTNSAQSYPLAETHLKLPGEVSGGLSAYYTTHSKGWIAQCSPCLPTSQQQKREGKCHRRSHCLPAVRLPELQGKKCRNPKQRGSHRAPLNRHPQGSKLPKPKELLLPRPPNRGNRSHTRRPEGARPGRSHVSQRECG